MEAGEAHVAAGVPGGGVGGGGGDLPVQHVSGGEAQGVGAGWG